MNINILKPGVQDFIANSWSEDIQKITLQKSPFPDITSSELAQQLSGKKTCKTKLPSWFNTREIYYPRSLHLEQASSEPLAIYKASLVNGESIIDLTGGMGVDTSHLSHNFNRTIYCEIDSELAAISEHNFKVLAASDIRVYNGDGLVFLDQTDEKFSWIYADPSRRSGKGSRVYRFSDCTPDVAAELPKIFGRTNHLLIKSAPFLDITSGLKELNFTKEIHVVALNNEVKEILWILEKDFKGEPLIKSVNIGKNECQIFRFLRSEETAATPKIGLPENFLFVPNAAILKAGAFKLLAVNLEVNKLHQNSHLYTASDLIEFPGYAFEIEAVFPYSTKNVRLKVDDRAHIVSRNFPKRVDEIRKKFKIKDGGVHSYFFTTNNEGKKIVIKARRI